MHTPVLVGLEDNVVDSLLTDFLLALWMNSDGHMLHMPTNTFAMEPSLWANPIQFKVLSFICCLVLLLR